MREILLHDYWRSGAAYRVRIALNLKGLNYRAIAHDLRIGEQRDPNYLEVAPQGLVPALEFGNLQLTQSLAIIEWLDEKWPLPPLLPVSPEDRAIVRAMAALVACDIHPLNNLRVLKALGSDFNADEAQRNVWISRWITDGFAALEIEISRHGRGFAFGTEPSMADCFIVPQIYSARRFGVDLSSCPAIEALERHAADHPAFAQAHPSRQPGAEG